MTQSILVERIKNYYREKYLGKKKIIFSFSKLNPSHYIREETKQKIIVMILTLYDILFYRCPVMRQ
jgi:hypothetical protein